MNRYMSKLFALLAICFFATGLLLSGHTMATAGDALGVKVAEKEGIGKYLTDSNGMTLYSFAKDEPGVSNCTGGCLVNWPAFLVEPAAVIEGCETSSFDMITKPDGSQQTTYKGMPLYYFINDKLPGDTNGQGLKDAWFTVTP